MTGWTPPRPEGYEPWPSQDTKIRATDMEKIQDALSDLKRRTLTYTDYLSEGVGFSERFAAMMEDANAEQHRIYLPYAAYEATETIVVKNLTPLSIEGATGNQGSTLIKRAEAMEGDLFDLQGPVVMANIGILDEGDDYGKQGAALKFSRASDGSSFGTNSEFHGVRITAPVLESGPNVGNSTWERIIHADGVTGFDPEVWNLGIRNVIWDCCYFFGARGSDDDAHDQILVEGFTHWRFSNCEFSNSPITGAHPEFYQGIRLIKPVGDIIADDAQFVNCYSNASFYSEATDVRFYGIITSDVHIDSLAVNNHIVAGINGTIVNEAPQNNNVVDNIRHHHGDLYLHGNDYSAAVLATRYYDEDHPEKTEDYFRLRADGLHIGGDGTVEGIGSMPVAIHKLGIGGSEPATAVSGLVRVGHVWSTGGAYLGVFPIYDTFTPGPDESVPELPEPS